MNPRRICLPERSGCLLVVSSFALPQRRMRFFGLAVRKGKTKGDHIMNKVLKVILAIMALLLAGAATFQLG